MEDMNFNIDGLLSPEEAEKLFGESQQGSDTEGDDAAKTKGPQRQEEDDTTAGEPEETAEPSEPANDNNGDTQVAEGTGDATSGDAGRTPDVLYSSIAKALRDDDILHLGDDEIAAVKDNEGLGELFEKEIQSRLDDKQRRIDSALRSGVQPDTVRTYENTIEYLNNIDDDLLSGEDEESENVRKQLIYSDLVNRGYSQDKANRELKKSIDSGSDVDDARDALDALRKYYKAAYDNLVANAKQRKDKAAAQQKKAVETLRKMTVDNDSFEAGGVKLDKAMRQRIFDATQKPVYRDESGTLLSAVQKLQREDPLEFAKQIGMWYVLTDGGKDWGKLSSGAAKRGRHEAMKELAGKINATSINPDGGLNLLGGVEGSGKDILLEDGWKIG